MVEHYSDQCKVIVLTICNTNDQQVLIDRIRKVIIHEIGHNMGLPHCSVDTCIMSENKGITPALDKCNGYYCYKCRILKQCLYFRIISNG